MDDSKKKMSAKEFRREELKRLQTALTASLRARTQENPALRTLSRRLGDMQRFWEEFDAANNRYVAREGDDKLNAEAILEYEQWSDKKM